MKIQSIKGMHDVGPDEILKWQRVESVAKSVFETASYHELKTPVLEAQELFLRGLGDGTDIIDKEMYVFEDKSGHKLCLRPEGTASVVRSYIEHYVNHPLGFDRFYYFGPMFRYERPQKGRYRQFYQIGLECFGNPHPWVDAEVICLAAEIFHQLKIDFTLQLNSLGCAACRPNYQQELIGFLSSLASSLCEDCQTRLHKNPLRILDCKRESCKTLTQQAPAMIESLCDECGHHFAEVQWALGQFKIPFTLNTRLVRGLDYYQRTAFEFISQGLGAQNAIAGGGRYDGLVETLGGPKVSGVGFAFGVERVVLLMEEKPKAKEKIYFACLGEQAKRYGFSLMKPLRNLGYEILMDFEDRSLKSHLKQANKKQAQTVLILGEQELKEDKIILKKMDDSLKDLEKQQELPLGSLLLYFEKLKSVFL